MPHQPESVADRQTARGAGPVPVEVVISYDAPPAIGGAHLWLYEVYRRWATPVTLLTRPATGTADELARVRAFDAAPHGALHVERTLAVLPPLAIGSLSAWRAVASQIGAIRRVVGRRSPARLHARCVVSDGFVGALYKALHRSTTLVTYAHGEEVTVFRSSQLLSWLASYTYRASDLVIANCENTRDVVADLCPDARIAVVHPGVDPSVYVYPRAEIDAARRAFGWSDGTCVLATVARMEARKNQGAVIRAVARLREEGRAVAYICAGGGPEKARLQALARDLGVEDAVRFPGVVSDHEKSLIFAACDVHVMASVDAEGTFEGFGMVFIEAAAAGVPSIAGATGGQREAVLDARTGVIVDGEDLDALASAIRRLLDDPALRARMGDEGRRWAMEHDWAAVVEKTERFLDGAR